MRAIMMVGETITELGKTTISKYEDNKNGTTGFGETITLIGTTHMATAEEHALGIICTIIQFAHCRKSMLCNKHKTELGSGIKHLV